VAEKIVVTRRLCRRYGKAMAVDDVNISVEKGQVYGLVGRNGAGKTTVLRLLSAQSLPTSGEIELFGETSDAGLSKARARTGAMVDIAAFYPYLSARENLEYFRLQRGIPGKGRVDEALEFVNLEHAGDQHFKHFPMEMKQRLSLALAIMSYPDLLLLDEPVNGLDPEAIAEFRRILISFRREREVTMLVSSHSLPELTGLVTHYGFIDKGRMLEQISAADLEEKSRACLLLRVGDPASAAIILERQLGSCNYEVLPDNLIRLYDFLEEPQKVTAAVVRGGVDLLSAEISSANPESYFQALIGGAGDA